MECVSAREPWIYIPTNLLIPFDIEKISPRFIPTPPASPYFPSAACLWERVYTTSIQASVALEMPRSGRAGRSGPGRTCDARAIAMGRVGRGKTPAAHGSTLHKIN